MEPRNDEPEKDRQPRKDDRRRRFQIVKLEERIAPSCRNGRGNQCHCDPICK